jgi:hypothetical protein
MMLKTSELYISLKKILPKLKTGFKVFAKMIDFVTFTKSFNNFCE